MVDGAGGGGARHGLSRRRALQVFAAAGMAAVGGVSLAACGSAFTGTRLTLATGATQGVYFVLGRTLADVWREHLGLGAEPDVVATAGSVQNLDLLATGRADVVFSQIDTVADVIAGPAADGPRAPRALARIYDDVVHVVVRRDSPYRTLPDLRGARVAIGAPNSGVAPIARRLLKVAGIDPARDLRPAELGINESVAAMQAGTIDAFFWSGGLPTQGVATLAATVPVRLLDLDDELKAMRDAFPVYSSGTVPAATYGIAEPVTTMLVRNVLLVPAEMADDLASALVEALFAEQPRLSAATAAALTIDARAAIGTQPVPLHPGAERFYRSTKSL